MRGAGTRGVSRRAAAVGLTGALALAALACGDDEEAAGSEAMPGASETQAASAEGALAGFDALDESAATPAAESTPGFQADDRVGEILDTDPIGAGLESLIRSARYDADPTVREAAVVALGDSEDDRALDTLIAATEDADSRVVLAAIDQLSWYDDRLAQDAIRRLVDSPNPEIAEAAREELDE
jgi:hypothetical protein